MATEINSEKLKSLICSFHNLTGIKVAVYDSNFKEILAYPDSHSSLCNMVRKSKYYCDECDISARRMCIKCATEKRVIVETCHAGLIEAVAPLTDGISVIGYVMIGQITNVSSGQQLFNLVSAKCGKYRFNTKSLEKVLKEMPCYTESQLDDASKILDALAGYIVFSKLIFPLEDDIGRKIVQYIRENLHEDLSVKMLLKKFFLSKAEIYRLTKAYMPNGIADFIKNERIEKACILLKQTDMQSFAIAEAVGFSDTDYFLRVFKKEMGMSAGKYRKNYKTERID